MSPVQKDLSYAAPVSQGERIDILDALRGFAILGILLMNIPGFGLPAPAGWDPSVYNEFGTINYKVWYMIDWIPEGTQRAIFSMLFGAGIVLFLSRQEQRVTGMKPAEYFFRRQLWLMVFGLFDIYILLWWGDILFDYGCYGFILFAFWKLSPKWLLTGAFICFLLMIARENLDLYRDKQTILRGELIAALDTTKVKLNEPQKEQLAAMTEFKENSTHEKKLKRTETAIRKTTGSYAQAYKFRTDMYLNHALIKYSYMAVWDVLLFMFLGMAFFKMGVLTGKARMSVYWVMAIAGLGIGLIVSYLRLQPMIFHKFNWLEYIKRLPFESYTVSRTFRALGILGTLLLLYRSGWIKWLFNLMRAPGQMAFTNYLTQSLICGIIFYGPGFAMFGKLQRYEVYYVVGLIWILQITWSHLWLRYYYFGPLEWCWRSLTYWKKQPFRKKSLKRATVLVPV